MMPAHTQTDRAGFQDDFIRALYGAQPCRADVAAMVSQPGFTVYRNTIIKGCIDTLTANYPVITRLVGDEWFRAAALIYVRATPPTNVSLLQYGEDFSDFLAAFEPARTLPYLPDVARLDRFWMEAHIAADETPLNAAAIAGLSPVELGQTILHPHASARWIWFDANPAYSIWSANRMQADIDDALDWDGEGALVTRLDGGVRWQSIGAGAVAFMDACAAGMTLEAAAASALDAQPSLDIAGVLSELMIAGAFRATT
jgi:hypothetical protein